MSTTLLSIIPFPSLNHSLSNPLPKSSIFLFNSPSIYASKPHFQLGFFATKSLIISRNSSTNEEIPHGSVEGLTVPDHWLEPSEALLESEWLRVTLHKWLDDEYCPEPTNFDISRVAANSYYQSLLQNTTDLGEILSKMARELESISYQESFHGAFSSANAAVSLIAERVESHGT